MRKLNNHKKIYKHDNNKPSAAVLNSLMTDLSTDATNWENNELKASTTKLYGLLERTYEAYKRFAGSKNWNSLLSQYLEAIGRPTSAKT